MQAEFAIVTAMNVCTVISLGGSIVAPDSIDQQFLAGFRNLISRCLKENPSRKFILIIGGGGLARKYQEACRNIFPSAGREQEDWIGIMATRLNAELVRGVFGEYCTRPVVTDPTAVDSFDGSVLVAAGWKPGFSTDNDAVLLAEKFGADTVINLSNIEKVYSDDPRTNPGAIPLDTISWPDFIAMTGDEWTPGKNSPFDPVASKKAAELGLKVIAAGGRDLENTEKILKGGNFKGTVIS